MIAVFDIGKTNAKLSAVTTTGEVLETLSTPNRILNGPPYRHHDLDGLEAWLLASLEVLSRTHEIDAIVPTAHGGSGVLVDAEGPVMPMVDYEAALPAVITARYRAEADGFRERGGSGIMLGSAHAARQLLWFQTEWPQRTDLATAWLHAPQYWAFRLSGVAADEVTSAAAQSHLWCAPEGRPAGIVARQGWDRLMPPMRNAWDTLGPLRPDLAARTGLSPSTRVLCGIHDSSANFYRYQAAGLSDMTVISTGTWIVALTDRPMAFDTERPGFSCNADVHGRPVPGMLTMGGREFSAVAGTATGPSDRAAVARLVERGVMALPFFGQEEGLVPGRAGLGRIVGSTDDRFTLAVLYAALLTGEILTALPPARHVVLDGTFTADPLYGALVQKLLPDRQVSVNDSSQGIAAGAALLATHATRTGPAPLALSRPDTAGLPDLTRYRARWRASFKMETHA